MIGIRILLLVKHVALLKTSRLICSITENDFSNLTIDGYITSAATQSFYIQEAHNLDTATGCRLIYLACSNFVKNMPFFRLYSTPYLILKFN